jgi:hypothetical protein
MIQTTRGQTVVHLVEQVNSLGVHGDHLVTSLNRINEPEDTRTTTRIEEQGIGVHGSLQLHGLDQLGKFPGVLTMNRIRGLTFDRVVEEGGSGQQVDLDVCVSKDGLKILDTSSGNVGESSESIGPPTVSITGVVKTQLLTKGVETVEDFGLDHQSGRDVVVTVSVGTSNDLGIGVSIHICL